MGFVIVAVDEAAGIRVRSLGSRAEIQNEHWLAEGKDFRFELQTRVDDKSDTLGRYKVDLSPSLDVIGYLLHGPGEPSDRKAAVDRVVEFIRYLFPLSFRGNAIFERRSAVQAQTVNGRTAFRTVDAPGLWDASHTGSQKGACDWVEFNGVRAGFSGRSRSADDCPHDTLAVQLPDRRPHYGEFRLIHEDDGTHYAIEVISFGFDDRRVVGNNSPGARALFSAVEAELVQSAIRNLVQVDFEKPAPVHDAREHFRGDVSFKEGWIRLP